MPKSNNNPVLIEETDVLMRAAAVRAYKSQSSRPGCDDIEKNLHIVHKIAHRVARYLKPPLAFEDLVSAGIVGLVRAAKDFDPSRHAEFTTYAHIRIKGAIIDEMRNWSFTPPDIHRRISSLAEISSAYMRRCGSMPDDEQLAEDMKISIDELYEIYQQARARAFLSLDRCDRNGDASLAGIIANEQCGPQLGIEQSELKKRLACAISELQQKERLIIILYYYRNMTMKQIAETLEITESRVSQLHARTLFNLSVKLKDYRNDK